LKTNRDLRGRGEQGKEKKNRGPSGQNGTGVAKPGDWKKAFKQKKKIGGIAEKSELKSPLQHPGLLGGGGDAQKVKGSVWRVQRG